jgi:hypothetical protein
MLLTLLQIADDTTMITGLDAVQKITSKLGFRLLIDLITVFLLMKLVYFPTYKKRELFFTFFVFNLVIFLISFLLNKVDLSMGAAFGHFAVFSMLRYRTEDISIKDMTYLFLVIAVGLVCAVTKIKGASDGYEYLFLGVVNGVIVTAAFLLESKMLFKKEVVKTVNYENIELVNSGKSAELMEDIKKRTGLPIHRISIEKIDFLRDSALIKIYYFEE